MTSAPQAYLVMPAVPKHACRPCELFAVTAQAIVSIKGRCGSCRWCSGGAHPRPPRPPRKWGSGRARVRPPRTPSTRTTSAFSGKIHVLIQGAALQMQLQSQMDRCNTAQRQKMLAMAGNVAVTPRPGGQPTIKRRMKALPVAINYHSKSW